jgi:hypothetical protein
MDLNIVGLLQSMSVIICIDIYIFFCLWPMKAMVYWLVFGKKMTQALLCFVYFKA